MNEILIKQKDFIYAVAHDLIRPDRSNDNVKEILAAYNTIDATTEVLVECSTCVNIYKDAFSIILAYINQPIEDKPKSKK
jgi:hypothetical protein